MKSNLLSKLNEDEEHKYKTDYIYFNSDGDILCIIGIIAWLFGANAFYTFDAISGFWKSPVIDFFLIGFAYFIFWLIIKRCTHKRLFNEYFKVEAKKKK